jgi:hypothetical protein
MKIRIITFRFPFSENGGDVMYCASTMSPCISKAESILWYWSLTVRSTILTIRRISLNYYYVKHNKIISLVMSFLALSFNKLIKIGYYFSLTYLWEFRKVIKKENPDLYIFHLLCMVLFLNF